MEATSVNRTIVRYVNAFASLSDVECDLLLYCVRERRLQTNEILFRQGDAGDAMVIVHHGTLSVRARRPDGYDAEVARVGTGEVLGEMCCIDPAPRSASVVAATPAMVCELSRDALASLREHAPAVYSTVMGAVIRDLSRRLREVDTRIEGMFAPAQPPQPTTSQTPPRAAAPPREPAQESSSFRKFIDRIRGLA